MERIMKYKAFDGLEFDTSTECITHDDLLCDVQRIMDSLEPLPVELNWEGYIQQCPQRVYLVKYSLITLCNHPSLLGKVFSYHENEFGTNISQICATYEVSWFLRLLDGREQRCVYDAFNRLACIDEDSREWEQIYYMDHPWVRLNEHYKTKENT